MEYGNLSLKLSIVNIKVKRFEDAFHEYTNMHADTPTHPDTHRASYRAWSRQAFYDGVAMTERPSVELFRRSFKFPILQ